MNRDKILVTIAARGGSKGVKNKNIRELCGVPLIAYTIKQAIEWGRADRIICSTDSRQIAEVAERYGAEVPFLRPKELARDNTGKIDVLRHAIREAEKIYKEEYQILLDLDVTAPIRKISDIEGCHNLYKIKRPKTVFSVTPCRRNPYFNMVEIGSDGYATLSKKPDFLIKRRQGAPKVYDMNASIYVYGRQYIMDENSKTAISDRSLIFVMGELSAFDIDAESDFTFVEFLIRQGLVKI